MAEKVAVLNILKSLRKRLALILGIAFLSIGTVWILMIFTMTENFQATSQILVEKPERSTAPANMIASLPDSQVVKAYSSFVKSREVLSKVIEKSETAISITDLHDKVTVTNVSDSKVINVTVEDGNSKTAGELANSLAYAVKEEAKINMKTDNISIISEAPETESPLTAQENLIFNLGIAGGFGLIVGSLLAFILELLNTFIKTGAKERGRKGERLQTVFK